MSHHSSQRGFTLIEMLVTISILVLLCGIVVANFRDAEKVNAVRLGAEQFVGALREAQNYALAQKRVEKGKATIVPPGFGVFIKMVKGPTTEYTFFADTGEKPGIYETGETGDLVLRTESLPRYATFGYALAPAASEASIVFSPPDGAVAFFRDGEAFAGPEGSVTIQLYDAGAVSPGGKIITVNSQTSLIEAKDF